MLVRRLALLDPLAVQAHVVDAVKRERRGRQAVTPGAPDFLIVGFDGFRQIGVGHEPHIRLVDAHAESDRRHHDQAVLLEEAVLILRAQSAVHAGVVGQRGDALPAKKLRQLLGLPPRAAIDDAAFTPVRGREVLELAAGVAFRAHGKRQVRPVETVDEDRRLAHEKPAENIRTRGGVGRRGERQDLDAGKLAREVSQIEIIGAEIVPPLRNAVGLVDGQQRGARLSQHRFRIVERQPLGRHVKQAQAAAFNGVQKGARFLAAVRGIERPRRDPEGL